MVPTQGHLFGSAWTSELLQTTKIAIKFNIISLFTLSLLIPENIVNTWVFFSGVNCRNHPDFPSRVKSVVWFEFTKIKADVS